MAPKTTIYIWPRPRDSSFLFRFFSKMSFVYFWWYSQDGLGPENLIPQALSSDNRIKGAVHCILCCNDFWVVAIFKNKKFVAKVFFNNKLIYNQVKLAVQYVSSLLSPFFRSDRTRNLFPVFSVGKVQQERKLRNEGHVTKIRHDSWTWTLRADFFLQVSLVASVMHSYCESFCASHEAVAYMHQKNYTDLTAEWSATTALTKPKSARAGSAATAKSVPARSREKSEAARG